MIRTGLILLITALFVTPIIAAQLKVEVDLVNVVATITDQNGRYVSNLAEDDLIVQEDGQPQKIAHISQSNDLPVSMGIVLDTSGSMERKIATATNAVERFIWMVHRDDDIFLMTFADRPYLLQDFTSDRNRLGFALERIRVGGQTALYDALYESLRKIKQGVYDKRAILLLTDGNDNVSLRQFDEVERSVRESEVLVYCMGISSNGALDDGGPYPGGGPTYPGGGPTSPGGGRRGPTINLPIPGIPGIPTIPGIPGTGGPGKFPALPVQQYPREGGNTRVQIGNDTVDMNVLDGFADASGGASWLLSSNWMNNRGSEIQKILDEIASELRSQYSIGYYPNHPLNDGKWHRIDIRTKDRRYYVRSRKEYFGQR